MIRFPILAKMARDYLALQPTSKDVEGNFSKGRRTIPYYRRSQNASSIRNQMLVNSGYNLSVFIQLFQDFYKIQKFPKPNRGTGPRQPYFEEQNRSINSRTEPNQNRTEKSKLDRTGPFRGLLKSTYFIETKVQTSKQTEITF